MDVWEKIQAKPNGLTIFCSRGWSNDNTVVRVLDDLAARSDGASRLACVAESLQNVSMRDDVSSLCVDGSRGSWQNALSGLVAQDFDVFALSGRDQKAVVTQALLTALEDRSVLVSVSFPDIISTLLWLVHELPVDARQLAQVLLGVIGSYAFLPRNCPACFQSEPLSDKQRAFLAQHEIEIMHDANFGRSKGCDNCGGTGWSGARLEVSEAIFLDSDLAELLQNRPDRRILQSAFKARGFKSRLLQTIEYAMRGETTWNEAIRIGLARRADL